jgi:hypothetical protein
MNTKERDTTKEHDEIVAYHEYRVGCRTVSAGLGYRNEGNASTAGHTFVWM